VHCTIIDYALAELLDHVVLLVELLVVCALLFKVALHVGGSGADETEAVLSVLETVH
jgi:hypothetical protein